MYIWPMFGFVAAGVCHDAYVLRRVFSLRSFAEDDSRLRMALKMQPLAGDGLPILGSNKQETGPAKTKTEDRLRSPFAAATTEGGQVGANRGRSSSTSSSGADLKTRSTSVDGEAES